MPKLVEGYVNKLAVPEGNRDVQVFDDALPGFGIRKFESGRASYFVKFNVGSATAPAHARRRRPRQSRGDAPQGFDHTVEGSARAGRRGREAHGRRKRNGALATLIAKYLKERQPKFRPRYYAEIKRQLEKRLETPTWLR